MYVSLTKKELYKNHVRCFKYPLFKGFYIVQCLSYSETKVELKKNCINVIFLLLSRCKETDATSEEVTFVLKDLTNEKLVKLNIQAIDWEDAVRKSAQPLIDEGKVKQAYVDDMIVGVKENGPYIVLTKHVALPHARPESGALESAIGIATLETPVEFGNKANDPVKYLFCLSAKDNSEHLNALAELASMFEDEEFFKLLDNAKDGKEIMDYINQ